MALIFFPCLLLFALTGKTIFAIGMGLSLVMPLLDVVWEGALDIFGGAHENETFKSIGFWVLVGAGAICIYFMMRS
jgi:hypothetical protein